MTPPSPLNKPVKTGYDETDSPVYRALPPRRRPWLSRLRARVWAWIEAGQDAELERLKSLSDRLPGFDPSWSLRVQRAWYKAHNSLVSAAIQIPKIHQRQRNRRARILLVALAAPVAVLLGCVAAGVVMLVSS